MSGCLESKHGGQKLLEFINFLSSELYELRGFELPSVAIMLNLDNAPGRKLRCSLAELSSLSGASESTAWRLTKILDKQNLIGIETAGENCLVLALTPYGRSLVVNLVSALNF
jgi:hypothetical protein